MFRQRLAVHNILSSKESSLKVKETRRLSPSAYISVLEFAGETYLVAHSESNVCLIATSAKMRKDIAEPI